MKLMSPSATQDSQHARPRIAFGRASRVAIALAVFFGLSGCGNLEPWVKPYERAALADPIMAAARDPVADEYMHHVYEVREGARGASGSAGGGCGCN
jgi:hypothetical protein